MTNDHRRHIPKRCSPKGFDHVLFIVNSMAEAIAFVNARPIPLPPIPSRSRRGLADGCCPKVSSGDTVGNHLMGHYISPQLPFGGVGLRNGAIQRQLEVEELSHRKSLLLNPFEPDPRLANPPYTGRAIKLIRRMYRA